MIRYKLLTLILLIIGNVSLGQKLQRRADLGIRFVPSGEKIVVAAIKGNHKLESKFIIGDTLLKIDDIVVKDYFQYKKIISNHYGGDLVNITVMNIDGIRTFSGNLHAKPFEKSGHSEVIYDQAKYKDGLLRVIINKPRKKGKLPAMLFIPGYTCSSIDNLTDNHPYKRIIDAYSKAGFVTLRIEKSGLGDSQNTPLCSEGDLYDEIENFEVGLKKLKSLSYVDTSKIIIVGHSMGGIVAPALSSKHKVAGVVVYGTLAKSWFEYQLEMYRVQNLLAKIDPLEYEKSIVDQYDLLYRFYIQKEPIDSLAKNEADKKLLKDTWMYDGAGKIYGRNAKYWSQIQEVNHLENWKNTTAKVLVQFGESDFQALTKENHEQIVRTVNYYRPGNAELKIYPLTDHYYAKSGTMQEAYDKFVQGKYLQLFNEYNFDVGNSAVEWSLKILGIENK